MNPIAPPASRNAQSFAPPASRAAASVAVSASRAAASVAVSASRAAASLERAAREALTRLLLLEPDTIARTLEDGVRRGLFASAPTPWQLAQGVARMLHRMVTRPDSVGLSLDAPPRRELAARLMQFRPVRGPALLALGAVRPWDLTGLLTARDGLIRHLVGTHHDRRQFGYDLEILRLYPGGLEALRDEAQRIIAGTHPRAALFRATCVYEGYHERLLAAVEAALQGKTTLEPHEQSDPDLSFEAFLAWCAARPNTLRELFPG